MLEPRAHAGFGDRVGDARGAQHRGVVGDVQLLAHHVDRQALHAGQRREPALEDHRFFGAVHAGDAEHRLGVHRALRADRRRRGPVLTRSRLRGRRLGLLDVAQALPEERHDVAVVERVEHHAAGPARAHQPQRAQQPQLMRRGRLAQAEQRRQIADAQLAVRQRVEHAHARRIAERAEGLGQRLDRRLGR